MASLRSKAMRRSPANAATVEMTKSKARAIIFSWRCKCNEEGRSQRERKDYQINKSADEKFKHSHKPALSVNATDREKNLHCKDRPEKSDNPSRQNARNCPVQSQRGEHDQHDR